MLSLMIRADVVYSDVRRIAARLVARSLQPRVRFICPDPTLVRRTRCRSRSTEILRVHTLAARAVCILVAALSLVSRARYFRHVRCSR